MWRRIFWKRDDETRKDVDEEERNRRVESRERKGGVAWELWKIPAKVDITKQSMHEKC